MKIKSLLCAVGLALGLTAAAGAITILSVAGSNGSQVTGGALLTATLNNLYTDLSSVGTVLGGATGAPSGSGAVCLTTSCAMTTPNLGTPSAINLTNATGTPSGAGVTLSTVQTLTLTQLQTLNSVGYTILAAPGATSMYMMGPCTLNLTFGSAAFTGGGTVSIGYGASSSPATNSTIASTVFTTFAASHLVTVQPTAQAVAATTSFANKPIVMTAAAADFAAGTGATGQISCQYSIITGVS